jgi:hypothetical protein
VATLAAMSGGGWTADTWLLLAYVGGTLGITFVLILLLHLLGRWLGR